MRRAGDQDVLAIRVAAETSDKERKTFWFDVSVWGAYGVSIEKYIRKGDKVTVIGAYSERESDGKVYKKLDAKWITLPAKSDGERKSDREPERGRSDDRKRDDDRRAPARDERRDDRRDSRRDDRGRDDDRGRGKSDDLPY
jgi:single-stranded DNA-binding protein